MRFGDGARADLLRTFGKTHITDEPFFHWWRTMSDSLLSSAMFLLVLLNPFLLVLYLLDLIQEYPFASFRNVLLRAAFVAGTVFFVFAAAGDIIFRSILQVNFASFQVFGGIIFLAIGYQFMFQGTDALKGLRGKPEFVAGSIAMPVMIGPATLSASVIIGKRLDLLHAVVAIAIAVGVSVAIILLLKWFHDKARRYNEALVERYIEVAGRVAALVIGTFAIEMIMQGIRSWRPGVFG